MTSNKTVFFIIGSLLIILGLFMLVPYGAQIFYKENSHSFFAAALITILIGVIFVLGNMQEEYQLNLKQTFMFSTFAWITVAFFGSIPFFLSNLTSYLIDDVDNVILGTITLNRIHNFDSFFVKNM